MSLGAGIQGSAFGRQIGVLAVETVGSACLKESVGARRRAAVTPIEAAEVRIIRERVVAVPITDIRHVPGTSCSEDVCLHGWHCGLWRV